MTTIPGRSLAVLLLVASTHILGGCLSESSAGADEPAPNTPGSGTNAAPSISGSPSNAVMAGDPYSFRPSASDPDGDPLTFSVSNLPRWASFDSATGQLSGQPLLGDVGVYDGIVVSVSDGSASASLPGFSVTVAQAALGSMVLSWQAPTQNSDGSTLTDLSGYKIYYGVQQGVYTNRIDINNPSVRLETHPSLPSGSIGI